MITRASIYASLKKVNPRYNSSELFPIYQDKRKDGYRFKLGPIPRPEEKAAILQQLHMDHPDWDISVKKAPLPYHGGPMSPSPSAYLAYRRTGVSPSMYSYIIIRDHRKSIGKTKWGHDPMDDHYDGTR